MIKFTAEMSGETDSISKIGHYIVLLIDRFPLSVWSFSEYAETRH